MNKPKRFSKFIITAFSLAIFGLSFSQTAFAAVGCTLNDPDRDVKRLFPKSTGYKTTFITIEERGGQALYESIQKRLGDDFDDVYETIDVPYAFYSVLKGKDLIGRIHGVNQKGTFGGLQIILATDPKGTILDFYYQKISSPESKAFRSEAFRRQFIGKTLKDFQNGSHAIKDPSKNSHDDFQNTLRGVTKNLILLDVFFLNKEANSHD